MDSVTLNSSADVGGSPPSAEESGIATTGISFRSTANYKIDPLACAYCAKCHSICPTYLPTKNEGYSARGKILLWSAIKGDFDPPGQTEAGTSNANFPSKSLANSDKLLDYLDFCTRCYRCLDVCPAGMATVPIFEAMRFDIARIRPPSIPLRILMRYVLPNRWLTRTLSALGEVPFSLMPFLAKRVRISDRLKKWLYSLPKYETLFCSLTSGSPTVFIGEREFYVPQSQLRRAQAFQFASRFQNIKGTTALAKAEYPTFALFIDCLTDMNYPGIVYSAVRTLNRLGFYVLLHPSPSCCGASALNTGDEKGFYRMAKNFANQFANLRDHQGRKPLGVVFTNPTCFKTVKERYGEVLSQKELESLPEPRLAVELIAPRLRGARASAENSALADIKMAWHNPCSLAYALGVPGDFIVKALQEVGLQIHEYKSVEGCCGFGGMFYARYPKRADELSAEKLAEWEEDGVELALTNSAGCISHLNATATRHRITIPTVHYLEVLSRLI